LSTRLIGAIIMVHGDNNGLVLPPGVAPVQIMVVPVATHKPGVTEKAEEITAALRAAGLRAKIDNTDHSPGWKFAECEMKGIPLRLEIGPKDMEAGQCVLVRRDTGEKISTPIEGVEKVVISLLEDIRKNMFTKAKARLDAQTFTAQSVPELKNILDATPGFVKAMWCGADACEVRVKEEATATSRCIPFVQENLGDTCFVCGKAADKMVVWSRAY
jgi:prolyl-tRNA synthetase